MDPSTPPRPRRMMRSRAVPLTAVPALAIAFSGCGDSSGTAYCVDRDSEIVANSNCDRYYGEGPYYGWYYGGNTVSGAKAKLGERMQGGENIAANNYPALARKGGFGGTGGSGDSVGRGFVRSGGGGG